MTLIAGILALLLSLTEGPYSLSTRRSQPLSNAIVYELKTDRTNYIVGEPVGFRFMGRNKSDSIFRGPLSIHPLHSSTRVQMTRDGAPIRVLKLNPAAPYEENSIIRTLAPGQPFTEEGAFVFDYGSGSLILDEPGGYEFKATYCDRPGDPNAMLESNATRVEVEPPPDRYRDAFEAYKRLDTASLVTWPPHAVDLTDEEILAAFAFLEQFPDSPWTRYVRRSLVPTVGRRVLHKKAPPEEEERLHLLLEREAGQQQPVPAP
jgi:hypothetical protein